MSRTTDTTDVQKSERDRAARRTAFACVGIVGGMVGLAYASVPLYDLFCRLTGFGGTPIVGTAEAGRTIDRVMTVRFDSNVAPGLPWRFSAEAPAIEAQVGKTKTVFYRVANTAAQPSTGVATFNVTPALAGAYFVKLQCFCFQEQTLAGGETMDSAVVFYIDPAIAEDENLKNVDTITLSYTYFPAKDGAPATTSALSAPEKPNL